MPPKASDNRGRPERLTKRAQCVLDRACALFSDHMDDNGTIMSGSYVSERAGLSVAFTKSDDGQILLSIVKLHSEQFETPMLEPVFRAQWRMGKTVHIMEWVDDAWERAFLAFDA